LIILFLLHKLNHLGIRGNALDWFATYLSNRYQQVVVQGCTSPKTKLTSKGVAQGSLLGPLMFLIYVNDFSKCLETSNAIMFADDTSLYTCNNNIKKLIETGNNELSNVDNWLVANKLAINLTKTKYIIFQTPKMSVALPKEIPTLRMNNTRLEKVQEIKFLGLIVNQHLSWTSHMKYLLTKIRCGLGAVCKSKPFLNQASLLHLYHSIITAIYSIVS